jgi:hypothetical protein
LKLGEFPKEESSCKRICNMKECIKADHLIVCPKIIGVEWNDSDFEFLKSKILNKSTPATDLSGCRLWNLNVTREGYGQFRHGSLIKHQYAHTWAYI